MYSNLITYEDESSEIYAHYRDEMSVCVESAERRNIDPMLRHYIQAFSDRRFYGSRADQSTV